LYQWNDGHLPALRVLSAAFRPTGAELLWITDIFGFVEAYHAMFGMEAAAKYDFAGSRQF
jgi:hypothetical protein